MDDQAVSRSRSSPRLGIVLGLALSAAAQQPSADLTKGEISGRIVTVGSARPLRGVVVSLKGYRRDATGEGPIASAHALTGADGGFQFGDLPAGRYFFNAFKMGHGVSRSPLHSVMLGAGQTISGLDLGLVAPSVIAGRVLDPNGRPVADVSVDVWRYESGLRPPSLQRRGDAWTDDEGRYRIWGLPAGAYYVRAVPPAAGHLTRPATYYPRTSDSAASAPVRVGWDAATEGIDIELLPPAKTLIVGRVVDVVEAGPCRRCAVQAARPGDPFPATRLRLNEDGEFRLAGFAPGIYRFTAQTSDQPERFATTQVAVAEGRVSETRLSLAPGGRVSGRATLIPELASRGVERARSPSLQIQVELHSDVSDGVNAETIEAGGAFVVENVPAGRARLLTNCGFEGGYLVGARRNGQALASPYFDIRPGEIIDDLHLLCDTRKATVDITVRPGPRRPTYDVLPPLRVEFIPVDARVTFNRYQPVGWYGGGVFTGATIEPGRYLVYAVSEDFQGDLYDPETQRLLAPYAREATLEPDQEAEIDLVAAPSGLWLP